MATGLLLFFSSCEDSIYTGGPCSHCTSQEPSEGKVHLHFSFDDHPSGVPFTIYEKTNGSTEVVFTDTSHTDLLVLFLGVERDYVAEAVYSRGEKVFHAFDGGKIRVRETECDEVECYYTRVLKLDLRLIQH